MNSLFFKFFFQNFFLAAVLYNTLVQKIYAQKKFTGVSNQNLTDIYIFLTLNGPYRIKRNISFFHLKKKTQTKTTKTSADQLTSQIKKTRNM